MATYRKNKAGEWVVFGLVTEVQPGVVAVTKRDGSRKEERVVTVSKPFLVDGIPHCYGIIAAKVYQPNSRRTFSGATKECWECGCKFTWADSKTNGGDWSEGYCGC